MIFAGDLETLLGVEGRVEDFRVLVEVQYAAHVLVRGQSAKCRAVLQARTDRRLMMGPTGDGGRPNQGTQVSHGLRGRRVSLEAPDSVSGSGDLSLPRPYRTRRALAVVVAKETRDHEGEDLVVQIGLRPCDASRRQNVLAQADE